jgi:sensor histidine kinase YesM
MSGMYLCAALTPVILRLVRKFPIERKNWPRRVALHLLFSMVFSVVELAIHSAILLWFGLLPSAPKSFTGMFLTLFSVAFQQNLVVYWLILGISRGVRFYLKYREREKQAELNAAELRTELARAQLSALKAQLQPHFLFNALNAVMVLVRQRKARDAEETLTRLSDLLRCVLEDVEAQEVPLRRELEYLQLYLSIEQVRFQDRLRIEISAGPDVLDAAVPHMGLQPIVENAIRHGIGRSSSAGRIEIGAALVNGSLEIRVRDDGPGLTPAPAGAAHGIGLANTRARLYQLYGDSARLTLENDPRGGAIATVILPYHVVSGGGASEVVEAHAIDNVAG